MQLRTGGLVIGWLGVVGSIFMFVACVTVLSQKDYFAQSTAARIPSQSKEEITKGIKHCIRINIDHNCKLLGLTYNISTSIVPILVSLIASVLLIFGTLKVCQLTYKFKLKFVK